MNTRYSSQIIISVSSFSVLFVLILICMGLIKCKKNQQVSVELDASYNSSNDQIIFTVNQGLRRNESVLSYESALRNSTNNSQDEYKLPTYDEFKSKKMHKTFN